MIKIIQIGIGALGKQVLTYALDREAYRCWTLWMYPRNYTGKILAPYAVWTNGMFRYLRKA